MKEFDYIIIGGGCAGLSLAYELEINNKLKEKTLAIIETRDEYKRDKTWSFWKVFDHNFEDCVIKSWNNFTINSSEGFHELINKSFPYQSINSEKFYKKIGDYILKQKNIENYNRAGKIYVPLFEKIIQTFLSIFDFVKLLFVKDLSYDNHSNHKILEKEINLNERI